MNGELSTVMSPRTVINWAQQNGNFPRHGLCGSGLSFLNKCDELIARPWRNSHRAAFDEELPERLQASALAKERSENPMGKPTDNPAGIRSRRHLPMRHGFWPMIPISGSVFRWTRQAPALTRSACRANQPPYELRGRCCFARGTAGCFCAASSVS